MLSEERIRHGNCVWAKDGTGGKLGECERYIGRESD
jgi:hypothetical protein